MNFATKRSPQAEKFDPVVQKIQWTIPYPMVLSEVLEALKNQFHLEEEIVQKALWHQGFRVNGKRCQPKNFTAGELVEVYMFTDEPQPINFGKENILHEDDNLLVINKPAWLVVQPTRASIRCCLDAYLLQLGYQNVQAIHRLDKATSGLILYAKNPGTQKAVGEFFAARTIVKKYIACVYPAPSQTHFRVEGFIAPVFHSHHSFFALFQEQQVKSRYSCTDFNVLKSTHERTWLEALLHTGRTHQIRVHLASVNCPIIGDTLYGKSYEPHTPDSHERLLLHAHELHFVLDGKEYDFIAPLPIELRDGLYPTTSSSTHL